MQSPDRPSTTDPINSDTDFGFAAFDLFPFKKLYSRVTELRELLLFQLQNIDRVEKELADLELYQAKLIEESEQRLPTDLDGCTQRLATLEKALENPEEAIDVISPELDYETIFAEISKLESEQANIMEAIEAARTELNNVAAKIQNLANADAAERYRRQIIYHTAADLFSAFECFVRDLLIEDVLLSGQFLVSCKANGKTDLRLKGLAQRQQKDTQEKIRGAMCFFLDRCQANFQNPNTASELYVDYFNFEINKLIVGQEVEKFSPSEETLLKLRQKMQLLTSMRHSIIHSEGSKRHPEYRSAFNACRQQLPKKLLESDDIPDPYLVLATAVSEARPELLGITVFHDVVLRFCGALLVNLKDRKDELATWIDSLRNDKKMKNRERIKFFETMGFHWKPPKTIKLY